MFTRPLQCKPIEFGTRQNCTMRCLGQMARVAPPFYSGKTFDGRRWAWCESTLQYNCTRVIKHCSNGFVKSVRYKGVRNKGFQSLSGPLANGNDIWVMAGHYCESEFRVNLLDPRSKTSSAEIVLAAPESSRLRDPAVSAM